MTTLTINSRAASLPAGTSLFDAAERLGILVPSSCRKQGKCRECLVEIVAGMSRLSPRTPEEAHLKDGFRLACRCTASGLEGEVRAHTLRRMSMQIERTAEGLPRPSGIRMFDPAVTREADRILLDGREIARGVGPLHGVAIDLGTTTVVIRVLDLQTGETVATAAFENPQRFGGSDVMSRIQFDREHPGRLLQRTLLGYLTRSLRELPVDPSTVYEVVVAGNPTMRDLFFGLDVSSIGQKPYWSLTQHELVESRRTCTSLSVSARALHLPCHPEARVYGLPVVGGHVGGDAAATLLALRLHERDEWAAIMDLGTNTEVLMGNRDRILAASCPAGPAFEGRGVRCGMPGLEGAIAHVALDTERVMEMRVIGEGRPEGICGSGLIALLGELMRTGSMNAFGRFENGEDCFVVDAAGDIALSERDVNELAQAKGANVAGLQLVAKRFGRSLNELDRFYLAGGFGRHIDIASARRIGLIPDLPGEKIVQVGNAAIEGASIALLSVSQRRELERLVREVEHVELETDPDFFDLFVAGCQFKPVGLDPVVESVS